MTTNGTLLPEVVPLNVLSIVHATDTEEFDNLSLLSSPSSLSSDKDSQCSSKPSKRSFIGWQQSKRESAQRSKQLNECMTTAQWLEYVGACDFNQKLGKIWGTDLQTLSRDKIPLTPIGSIKTEQDPPLRKTKRRNQNCEAAKLHKKAEKKFDEENNQDQIKDLHPTPDRFKAFTIGNRQLLFEKAKQSPSEYNISGYEAPLRLKR